MAINGKKLNEALKGMKVKDEDEEGASRAPPQEPPQTRQEEESAFL